MTELIGEILHDHIIINHLTCEIIISAQNIFNDKNLHSTRVTRPAHLLYRW